MKKLKDKHIQLFLCFALAILVVAVYLPVRNYGFVLYDDDVYIFKNPHVQTGLTADNIEWAFTTNHAGNWHPLTWISLMLDCSLFGAKPGPLHLVNVFFHAANAILVLLVLNRMTRRLWASVFVAALFALHPLHVESVAWVTERKDVLSTFFWLLTMLTYVLYVERPSMSRYAVSLLFFALGLMSKPMLVTLPFVLILIDYWPLNRFLNSKFSIRNSIVEKIPFFLLSIASCAITFLIQKRVGAVLSASLLPFDIRLKNAICSYLAYIGKMFCPTHLAVLYPYQVRDILPSKVLLSAITLIIITILAIYYAKRYRYLIVGWLWYLGTLVPVIGVIQVGVQALADRYTYVPLIGLFIIIAFAADDLFKTVSFRKYFLAPLAIVIIAGCIAASSIQLKYWKNSITLFEHTLAVTKNNPGILNDYANVLSFMGNNAEAVKYFEQATAILPGSYEIRHNFGKALQNLNRTNEAIEQYQLALKINPDLTSTRYNLGSAFFDTGQYDKAMEQFKLYLGPNADLLRNGVTDETTARFKQAFASKPDTVKALSRIGYCLAQKANQNMAVLYYQQALLLDPGDITTHGQLAIALAALGKIDESIEQCQIFLKASPNEPEMQTNLGLLFESKGQTDKAVEAYKKALQIDPNFVKARDSLNTLLQKPSSTKQN